jgi:hypothetical protein
MIPQNIAPILVLNTQTRRQHGRKAQLANIAAAKVTHIRRKTEKF